MEKQQTDAPGSWQSCSESQVDVQSLETQAEPKVSFLHIQLQRMLGPKPAGVEETIALDLQPEVSNPNSKLAQ